MKKPISLFILALLLLSLISCREDDATQTPTPFNNINNDQMLNGTGQVVPVEISDLAANPAFYQGATIEITGQYKRVPQVVCGSTTHQSIATYGLRDGQLLTYATGYQNQIRELLPEGIAMTVVGQWQYWSGPVGCGKRAKQQEIWYLDVDQIVSPNPLVKMTVTPGTNVIAQVSPTAPFDGTLPPELVGGAATETPLPAETPTPTSEIGDSDGDATTTAVASPTPTSPSTPTQASNPDETATPTADSATTATPTPANGTSDATTPPDATTPTATSNSNSTPTATPDGSSTPTATTDPGATTTVTPTPSPTTASNTAPTVITKSALSDEDPIGDELGPNETHSWTIDTSSNDEVTLYLAVLEDVPAKITLLDSNDNLLAEASTSGSGQVATISAFGVSSAGTYKVNVNTTNGAETKYALLPLLVNSYDYVLQGFLKDGDSKTPSLDANTDHFWAFYGENGDTINLTVTPSGGANFIVEVWYDGSTVTDGTNLTHTLTDTGIYFIWIGEEDYNAASYSLSLSGN